MTSLIAMCTIISADDPWASLRMDMDKVWPNNQEIRIVCHGHSVPAGYFVTPKVDTFNAYPHLLHVRLKEAHPSAVVNVVVTAIGGEGSVQGAARFKRDVLSLKPKVVTIDYALNDRWAPLEDCRKAWESMVKAALADKVMVILLTPTPDLKAKIDDPNDPLSIRATMIREIAEKYKVSLADPYATFVEMVKAKKDLKPFMSQNNHPNRKGHEIVVEKLLGVFSQ
jgi:acyl-CoA thioesterase I